MKTYIAPGLLDLRLVIYTGKAWITVEFKGGRSCGYGDYIATFSTADLTLQYLIERSPEFQSGRIQIATGDDAQ